MKYAYVRASTRKQYRDGNELLKQKSKLQEAGFDELVVEEFGETTNTRPCFEVLKARLQAGDTLLVTTLDRVARSATEGVELIKEFLKRGVAVHILNMGLIDNTPAGKLIIRILLAFVADCVCDQRLSGFAVDVLREAQLLRCVLLHVSHCLFPPYFPPQPRRIPPH